MDMDMDGKFHIHGKPAFCALLKSTIPVLVLNNSPSNSSVIGWGPIVCFQLDGPAGVFGAAMRCISPSSIVLVNILTTFEAAVILFSRAKSENENKNYRPSVHEN